MTTYYKIRNKKDPGLYRKADGAWNSSGKVYDTLGKVRTLITQHLNSRSSYHRQLTEDTFKAAAANADWNKSYYQILTEQKGKDAWPITGATFILVHVKPDNAAQSKTALDFFDWAFTKGDKSADDLDYVALPATVKNKIRADWKRLGLK